MTQTQQFDADVAGVEPEGQLTFIHNGKEWVGQRPPIVDKLSMVEAGFEVSFDFSLEVRTAQFPDGIRPPANGDVIKIGDVEYRIRATTPDQFGVVNKYDVKQN